MGQSRFGVTAPGELRNAGKVRAVPAVTSPPRSTLKLACRVDGPHPGSARRMDATRKEDTDG